MFALLDSFIEPQDGGDIAPAWDRAMASSAALIIATPGAAYSTTRELAVIRRVVFVGWLATIYCAMGGFKFSAGGASSLFFGATIHSNNKAALAHGYNFAARAIMLWCSAIKFGGDGFHVEADVVHEGSNANSGTMIGCSSTGHLGRGFSWRGGDSNAWLALMCTTSGCVGEYAERKDAQGVDLHERVPGFHDDSFLGCRLIACHSGTHIAVDGVHGLGYCSDNNSSAGVVAFCYQENGCLLKVQHHNTAIGNLGGYTADSDALIISGRRIRGLLEYTRGDAIGATLSLGRPIDGAIGELKAAGDAHGYALLREAAPSTRWVIRRANSAPQTVLAFRTDKAAVVAPLGVSIGYGQHERLVTFSGAAPAPSVGVVGDLIYCSSPVEGGPVGWQKVTGPNGAYWRAI